MGARKTAGSRMLPTGAALSFALACTGAIAEPAVPPPAPASPAPANLDACAMVPAPAGASVLARLTRDEVRRSLRDALALPPGALGGDAPRASRRHACAGPHE